MAVATITRHTTPEPAGTAFSRYAIALGLAKGDPRLAAEFARELRTVPQVHAALVQKAAVGAGNTSDSTWAGSLAASGIAAEAMTLLDQRSVVARLASRMRRVPFRLKVGRETNGAAAGWAREGFSRPLTKSAFDQLALETTQNQALVVASKELLRFGDLDAERVIRDSIFGGLARHTDEQFLSPSVSASSTRPASITYGATAIAPGSPATVDATELELLIRAITTSGEGLTWILRPTTAAIIAAKLGQTGLPDTLLGLPAALSANAPNQITLVDLAEIAIALGDDVDLDVTDKAVVEMSDSPTNEGITPTASNNQVSLWQAGLVGFLVSRYANWERARDGAVAYMPLD